MREADLLPVGYFHVVFTVPSAIADIAFYNKATVYDLLFQAASETMLIIACKIACNDEPPSGVFFRVQFRPL